jgi:hypothetical protein
MTALDEVVSLGFEIVQGYTYNFFYIRFLWIDSGETKVALKHLHASRLRPWKLLIYHIMQKPE